MDGTLSHLPLWISTTGRVPNSTCKKKSYSAATMILQCSVFTEFLSVPAFCRIARIQGFAASLTLKSLHKNIVKLKTYSAMISQKDVFFQTFSKCYPQGSILVALEGAADHSSKMLETWTCSYWLHKWKVSEISVHHYYLCDLKGVLETLRYTDQRIIWRQRIS